MYRTAGAEVQVSFFNFNMRYRTQVGDIVASVPGTEVVGSNGITLLDSPSQKNKPTFHIQYIFVTQQVLRPGFRAYRSRGATPHGTESPLSLMLALSTS